VDVTVKWSMDEEDSREVYLEVDTGDDVDESREDDNRWQDSQAVTFEGGSPGFGALLAVLAASVAALLVGRTSRR
jgi:PGF-CTERM protein